MPPKDLLAQNAAVTQLSGQISDVDDDLDAGRRSQNRINGLIEQHLNEMVSKQSLKRLLGPLVYRLAGELKNEILDEASSGQTRQIEQVNGAAFYSSNIPTSISEIGFFSITNDNQSELIKIDETSAEKINNLEGTKVFGSQ